MCYDKNVDTLCSLWQDNIVSASRYQQSETQSPHEMQRRWGSNSPMNGGLERTLLDYHALSMHVPILKSGGMNSVYFGPIGDRYHRYDPSLAGTATLVPLSTARKKWRLSAGTLLM